MKTITIWGYAALNLGDDLFFQTLVQRYPQVRFFQYAQPKHWGEYAEEENLKILPHWQRSVIYRSPFSYPKHGGKDGAQVIVGGSIFQDDNNWARNNRHYRKIQETGQPTFVIGSNVGPVKTERFTKGLEEFFVSCADVVVRDTYSKEIFRDIHQVRHVPDLILGRKETGKPKPGTLGISVMDLGETYIQTITKWVEEAVDSGYAVTLFSFSKKLGDEVAIEQLKCQLDSKTAEKVQDHRYSGNIEETLKRLSTMETMIATRFHAMILGVVLNQKVFSITYGDKTRHVLADFPHTIPSATVEEIPGIKFSEIITSLKGQPFDWTEIKEKAEQQFAALDQWVGEGEKENESIN